MEGSISDGDITQITPTVKQNLADIIQNIINIGILNKAKIRRYMSLSSLPEDVIYKIFLNSPIPGDVSLYEVLSILYDKTSYSMETDSAYKKENPGIEKLLVEIPVFLEDISENKLPETTDTIKRAIKYFDDYMKHIQRKGLVPSK